MSGRIPLRLPGMEPLLSPSAVVVAAGWMAAAGCVVPAGPSFQKPPDAVNYAPFVVTSDPAVGSEVSGSIEIQVTLADPNPGDHLFVRWISDYPPYASNISRLMEQREIAPSLDGDPVRTPISFKPECAANNIARNISQHRIYLAVADREFLEETDSPPDLRLSGVAPGTNLTIATWLLDFECD